MKKFISIIVCAIFLFSLVSCNGKTVKETKNDKSSQISTKTEKGSVDGRIYTNDYFGFKFEVPNSWEIYDDEHLEAMTYQSAEATGKMVESLDDCTYYFDFMTVDNNNGTSISAVIEKIDSSKSNYTDKTYLTSQIDAISSTYTSSGYTDVKVQMSETEFLGETVPCISSSFVANTTNVYQTQICVIKGDFAVTITVSTYSENTTEDVISDFYAE